MPVWVRVRWRDGARARAFTTVGHPSLPEACAEAARLVGDRALLLDAVQVDIRGRERDCSAQVMARLAAAGLEKGT